MKSRFKLKTPIRFFLDLIPHHTHPQYALMVSYPFVTAFVVINCMYFLSLFFDAGLPPTFLAESNYDFIKISK